MLFGGDSLTRVAIKDIFEEPIKMGAPKIILVHNHPRGDSTPSELDIRFTEIVRDAASLLGIELIDHLVIGNKTYKSVFSKMK